MTILTDPINQENEMNERQRRIEEHLAIMRSKIDDAERLPGVTRSELLMKLNGDDPENPRLGPGPTVPMPSNPPMPEPGQSLLGENKPDIQTILLNQLVQANLTNQALLDFLRKKKRSPNG